MRNVLVGSGLAVGVMWLAGLAGGAPPAAALDAAPVLQSPADGASLTAWGAQDLLWQSPPGARHYQVQVTPYGGDGPALDLVRSNSAGEPAPGRLALAGDGGSANGWMLPDMTYTWRVRASDGRSPTDAGWGPWSEARRFRSPTAGAIAGAPLYPAVDAVVDGVGGAALTWPVTDPNVFYFEVRASTDDQFRTGAGAIAPLWNVLVNGSSAPPFNSWLTPALQAGRPYYWQVRPRVQGDARPVAWSPTYRFLAGPLSEIAFASDRVQDAGETYLMRPDGSGVTARWSPGKAPAAFRSNPRWAADSMTLAASGQQDTLLLLAPSGEVRTLPGGPGHKLAPAWSPDGTLIAYQTEPNGRSDIYVATTDGSAHTAITSNPDGVLASAPDWAPSGEELVFAQRHCTAGCRTDLVVARLDGTATRNLTNFAAGRNAADPAWSPTGDRIAFVLEGDVWTVNSDGAGMRRLTQGEQAVSGNLGRMASPPAWSPDGSRIAYAAAWQGNEEIYVMNADGSGPHVNITNHPGNDRSPAWRRNPPAPRPAPAADPLPDDLQP